MAVVKQFPPIFFQGIKPLRIRLKNAFLVFGQADETPQS